MQINPLTKTNMETQLKIEVGKFYRTRSGQKVRIYAIDGYKNYPIHGALYESGNWHLMAWSDKKNFILDERESYLDIVSEWQEPLDFNPFDLPSWAKWIAMEPNRDWYFYTEEPELLDEEWYSDERTFTFIPTHVAPKYYQGNWRESLYNVDELKRQYKAEKI